MNNEHIADVSLLEGEGKLLSESGYAPTAIKYYLDKPYMGDLPDADQMSEMLGSCGDTMKIYLKIDNNIITDARYQVLGCPGAISAAMAAVDIIKGKSLNFARKMNDGDVFKVLEDLPAKKHHCIQLAVKTLHKAIDEYREGISSEDSEPMTCDRACDCTEDCQKTDVTIE